MTIHQAHGYVARGVVKSYAGVPVLRGVDFTVVPGQVHGLFGHNGAGKSTLMKILAGAERPDAGHFSIDDRPVAFHTPADALHQGVACVYQELRLLPNLTVAQNIFLGREQVRHGLRDVRQMETRAAQLLEEYGLRVSPRDLVQDLSHPDRQLIEIIANLDRNASYLMLDEPTTAINGQQAEELLQKVRQIAIAKQVGVVLVSHKLDEVLAVCDEATMLLAGRVLFTDRVGADTKQRIVEAIVGEESREHIAHAAPRAVRSHRAPGETLLDVKGLSSARLRGVTMQARAGEIVGIYGLAGSGRTRFLRTLYGLEPATAGEIRLCGQDYRPRSPKAAMSRGVAFLTEERKKDGFVPAMSALQNVVLSTLDRYSRMGLVNHGQARARAQGLLDQIRIKGSVHGRVTGLSGGNQQKVLFARVIEQDAKVVLLDEPTKGVDIGAKADIYAIVQNLAEQGRCVIVVSSEEEELLETCDRIYVFKGGACSTDAVPTAALTVGSLRQLAWT
jgi:ribose transport system ATP-binding protein